MEINDKLLPNPSYKHITPSGVVSSGTVDYFEYGKLVVVYIQDIVFNQDITTTGTAVISGLPKAKQTITFHLYRHSTVENNSTRFRVRITRDGNIVSHYGTGLTGSNQYYGHVTYIKQ